MASKHTAPSAIPKISTPIPVQLSTQRARSPLPSPPPITLKDLQYAFAQNARNNEQCFEKIEQKTEQLFKQHKEELYENLSTIFQGLAAHIDGVIKRVDEVEQKVDLNEHRLECVEEGLDVVQNQILIGQFREMEFAIRIRGLAENPKENLREQIAAALAAEMGCGPEIMYDELERAYRVNSWIAQQRNLPRDVVVYFTRKTRRNEIMQQFYQQRFQILNQDVLLLKEIPPKILRGRRDFAFLTQELIFLDAEKAFDKLDWRFLIKTVESVDFGDRFIGTLQAIYQQQTAQIVINGDLMDPLKIQKGTRQGCPLSPLLFILTLEILLIKIRDSTLIKGIKINKKEYKLKAFTNDLVFTLSQPMDSLKNLMDIVSQYGKVSGFKVNVKKTKILTKNMMDKEKEDLSQISGFEIVKKVKYLGVFLTASNSKLYKNNYERLWQIIQKDLVAWKKLQFSIMGRIAAIKMNVLPKFLFLFQMTPILKKELNLQKWQRDLNRFIWEGKKSRVKFKIIQDTRERGGLKARNWKLYYD